MTATTKNTREIVDRLKRDILRLQGCAPSGDTTMRIGLGPVEEAFPHAVFPSFGVHEFIYRCREESAATCGFISGLLAELMAGGGICLWISTSRMLFPPSLGTFGVQADRVIFVEVARERDVLWAAEEALKCNGLAAVVAELQEMDFAQSRRLQLAVEKSRVTGLMLRSCPRIIGATACAARWRIAPLPSLPDEGLPGVGFPRWEVELLKVRNGNPGCWQLEWVDGRFVPIVRPTRMSSTSNRMKKIS
ncbi:ImuA family protein [Parapedobacter sp. 10938]|uniref:ImuA family protein n=1 Tax=Parapedobacter flavus TaxID=3110225 RepID=UPI002DBB8935|nr:Error-prone repair protein ImuA [Parapedobacter sp. 10938]MEC3879057.1 Error-prone repair protein ImuA [Parapedobacter sp. 10938]